MGWFLDQIPHERMHTCGTPFGETAEFRTVPGMYAKKGTGGERGEGRVAT